MAAPKGGNNFLQIGSKDYSVRDLGTKRWLEGRLNAYNTGLFTTPNYSAHIERPIAPVRNYVRYWLSPTTWQSRREKELNLGSASARGDYSYSSRYSKHPTYSRVASRLYTNY
ncbi:unnamed protein product [Gongylonema pulchrum]|uniref:NADH dehydrogenase [ubiquinone] 1 alpha subcomplex subunit 7 n=1 Tax=Gongylonema pulchrum TaxID=637853 RepID=A0A183E4D5_9BILA|nr:unnamed protein product [Gongylonema pulchrum]